MAAGFIADTASLPLVVSNPGEYCLADFKIGLPSVASAMVPVNVVAVLATLAALLLFFRQDIPRDAREVAQLKRPTPPFAPGHLPRRLGGAGAAAGVFPRNTSARADA